MNYKCLEDSKNLLIKKTNCELIDHYNTDIYIYYYYYYHYYRS